MDAKWQRPKTAQFGRYSFQVTADHFSSELVNQLKHSSDTLADSAIRRIQEVVRQNKQASKTASKAHCIYTTDFYTILRDHRHGEPVLERLWNETHTVPDWVNWEQVQRGQEFFYRYLIGNAVGFIHQGFIAENAASPSTAEVLVRSGGFSTKLLLRRILETAQFLVKVTHSLSDIQPGGNSHAHVVRIRLIHAMVRTKMMRLVQLRPDYFDTESFGLPLNDLDQIHGIAVFACNHAFMQLPIFGVNPNAQETADYVHLWRYIGHVLGVSDAYFSTTQRAKQSLESILFHQLRVTTNSRTLGYNFIRSITDLPPANLSVGLVDAVSRLLNGEELCDELGLGHPGFSAQACAKGLSWLIFMMAWAQWLVAPFDRWIIQYWRKLLFDHLATNEKVTNRYLGKQYTPMLGKRIGKESHGRKISSSLFSILLLSRPVELFLFVCYVVQSTLIAAGLGIVWYTTSQAYYVASKAWVV